MKVYFSKTFYFILFILGTTQACQCQKATISADCGGKCLTEQVCVDSKCVTACKSQQDCTKQNMLCLEKGYCGSCENQHNCVLYSGSCNETDGLCNTSTKTTNETDNYPDDNDNNNSLNDDNNSDDTSNTDSTCMGESPPCKDDGVCSLIQRICVGENYLSCFDNNDNALVKIPDYRKQEIPEKCVNDTGVNCCNDNLDNDCDGIVDCDEPECSSHPVCTCTAEYNPNTYEGNKELSCDDSNDNDCDGNFDCADSDCENFVSCKCASIDIPFYENEKELSCSDLHDNDCDGHADCADEECKDKIECICHPNDLPYYDGQTETSCNDNHDNDCDGQADCADSDCASVLSCICNPNDINNYEGQKELSCEDNYDNDCDGKKNCADPDCSVLLEPNYCCNVIANASKKVTDKTGNRNHGELINNSSLVTGRSGHGKALRSGQTPPKWALEVKDCGQLQKFVDGVTIESWVYLDYESTGAEFLGEDITPINPCVTNQLHPYCGEFWIARKSSVFTFLLDEDQNTQDADEAHYYTHSHPEVRIQLDSDATESRIAYLLNTKPPTQTWFHFAATFKTSDKDIQIYINGAKQADIHLQHPGKGNTLINSISNLIFGNFPGMMDEIKVTNRAKTAAEILSSKDNFFLSQGELVKFDFE